MADLPTVVILAGGRSRRMAGQTKGCLLLAGKPLLTHVMTRMHPQASRLILNTNDLEPYREFGLVVLPDTRPQYPGPLAGVESALQNLGEAFILTVPVDTPFLPASLSLTLMAQAGDRPVVAASRHRLHPVITLWPRTALPAIRRSLDRHDLQLSHWFAQHPHQVVPFPDDDHGMDPFFNINHPADLALAETMIQERRLSA